MQYSYAISEYHTDSLSIGTGSFGKVFKGKKISTNTCVAIKKIHKKFGPEEYSLTHLPKTIKNEIAIMEELHPHENIRILLELVIDVGTREFYMIFEYLDMDLTTYIKQLPADTYMAPPLIKSFLYQLNNALIYCKEKRIIHRDIKSSNSLLSLSSGVIKLADFGMAILSDGSHDLKTYVGALNNRAPELLLKAETYSYSVDVWALACVFAKMATKKRLFPGCSRHTQLIKIFKVLTTPTEDSWPGVGDFPDFSGLPTLNFYCLPRKVRQLDECGLDLLKCMLTYDPYARITVLEIEEHPYFKNVDVTIKPQIESSDSTDSS